MWSRYFWKCWSKSIRTSLFDVFMISSNFSFPFGRFRKPSTIFKFHELSQTFSNFLKLSNFYAFLTFMNFHKLSQTFYPSFIISHGFELSQLGAKVRFHKFSITKVRTIVKVGRSTSCFFFPGSFFMSLVALFRSCSASRMLLYISEESQTGRPPKGRDILQRSKPKRMRIIQHSIHLAP